MEGSICSREFRRDYYWSACNVVSEFPEKARSLLAPAFEGALSAGRFVVLFRGGRLDRSIVLCVSVSTKRKDFIDAPIRTMAFLRAENPDEEQLLASFFAECLRKKDEETLYDPKGGVAKAVESLYQTKEPDEFLAFCKSLKLVAGKGGAPENRWAIPRDDEGERKSLADALPEAIAGDSPFLFALTDRLPTDVLASLGSMFDHAVVRIFSKAITAPEKLPEPASQNHRRAAAIGGVVLLVFLALLVAAVRSCSREGRAHFSANEKDSDDSKRASGKLVGWLE